MVDLTERRPTLNFFGGPEVRDGDDGIIRLTPTQEALLTLVWGHESQGVTRRRAIGLLWEEDDTPRGRHRLSQVLHEIYARIGVRAVEQLGDHVLLPAEESVRSDLVEFRSALQKGALQRALAIEDRGFATRLRRVPGESFEDWLVGKRAGLRRELRETAAKAWDRHHPGGEWRAAREAAEVLHLLDPDNAGTFYKVIESRAMTGGFEAAEAAFAAHAQEAGGAANLPEETQSLMERVRRLAGDRNVGGPRDPRSPPPLVGRRESLQTARDALDRVRRGGFEFVLLQGESGVGKTRLLDEIRKEAHLKGFRCLQARAVELEYRIPLNPLVDALSHPEVGNHLRELDEPWRAVIAALLPHLPPGMERSEVPPIAESSLSRRLYDAFWMLFTRIAVDEPTLLFIDDLQWADATTIAVLQFVQRRWQEGSFGVICTVRRDLVTDGDGAEKYLIGIDELAVTRIPVEDLAPVDATELVNDVAGGQLDPTITEKLCALGGRNPFYLIELTRDFLDGHLRLPQLPSDAVIVPISVRQLVDPRLETLSEKAGNALNILAIWGRWAALTDLATIAGGPQDEIIRHVEELERQRLVSVDRDQVRVAHELFRGAVYHRLSEARRAMLHRRVAEHLLSGEEPQVGELAVHFGKAGDNKKATLYGRKAADAALENGAMAEAAHFLQVVMENESDPVLRAEATGDLGRVLHMKRDMVRATPMLKLAAERLREVGREGKALRMEIRWIEAVVQLGQVDPQELLRDLRSIRDAARSMDDDEAVVISLDSELHLLDHMGYTASLSDLFPLIRQYTTSPDPSTACRANAALAIEVFFGNGEDALAAARKAVALAERHGLAEHLFLAQMRLYIALYCKGLSRSEEAVDLLSRARLVANRSGDVDLRFQFSANVGAAEMDAGNFESAAEHFQQAKNIIVNANDAQAHLALSFNLGELALLESDYRSALTHFRAAEDLLRLAGGPASRALPIAAGVGLSSLEVGELAEARRQEAQTSSFPDDWYFDPYVLITFHARARERRGEVDAALALLREQSSHVWGRLPNVALKLLLVETRLARRVGDARWRGRAAEGVELAERLGFSIWKRELSLLLGR